MSGRGLHGILQETITRELIDSLKTDSRWSRCYFPIGSACRVRVLSNFLPSAEPPCCPYNQPRLLTMRGGNYPVKIRSAPLFLLPFRNTQHPSALPALGWFRLLPIRLVGLHQCHGHRHESFFLWAIKPITRQILLNCPPISSKPCRSK